MVVVEVLALLAQMVVISLLRQFIYHNRNRLLLDPLPTLLLRDSYIFTDRVAFFLFPPFVNSYPPPPTAPAAPLTVRTFKAVNSSVGSPGLWLLRANLTGQTTLLDVSGGVTIAFDSAPGTFVPPKDTVTWLASDCSTNEKGTKIVCDDGNSRVAFRIMGSNVQVAAKATDRPLVLNTAALSAPAYFVEVDVPADGPAVRGAVTHCANKANKKVVCS